MKIHLAALIFALSLSAHAATTRISLKDGRWYLNDRITNPGSAAEGLLMSVRMVNATFEDRSQPDFDAEANTDRFIAKLPEYLAQGVNAFTLCLQGGMPGYEGAVNSAFEPDGALRPEYLRRVERVIRACDERGAAVIVGLYYQRQSKILRDEAAVRAGVVNAVRWLQDRAFQNVMLEVANEYPHRGFDHEIIRHPEGEASLLRLAKEADPALLVTASGYGDGRIHPAVAAACDFLTPHWNGTKVEDIPERLAELRKFGKAIVVNEDNKTKDQASAALKATVDGGAGYGLMLESHNQHAPFHFDGAADDSVFYPALKAMTSAGAKSGFKGRIAYSCDGNHNDPDDWISSPVALAIFAEAGVKERLAHFDYNCILPLTDPAWEKTHAESVLGAAERYGYDRARFFDCRQDLDRAVADIARVINESSEENPLWFILAGPMEVPYLGIQKSDPAKRRFVHCISHSSWNDGYSKKYQYTHTKRSVIEQEVNWVQIRPQNLLSTSPYGREPRPDEWRPFHWLRDAQDPRVRWLWERMLVSTRPDCSDAGMAWFAVTGDEQCDPAKLERLLNEHRIPTAKAREQVRLEAENFRQLDGFAVEYLNDKKASQTLQVALQSSVRGRIATTFQEPFATAGRCAAEVRFKDEAGCQPSFALLVNGVAQGAAWESPGEGRGWTTHLVDNVHISAGAEIAVEATGSPARLDYVQLDFAKSESSAPPVAVTERPAAVARLRVAVVQMAPRPSLAENQERILAGIAAAADRQARVAVFPESALSGRGEERSELAEQALEAFRHAAREHDIYLVLGAHTWLASVKKPATWMIVISPDGQDLFRYEKLYDNHRATMPGVFLIDGVPCSTMICADRWLRGVVELPIQQGAQISFELSNNFACEWVPAYQRYWNVPLALRNRIWSVLTNGSNITSGSAAVPGELKHGHSAIIAPDGHLVAEATGDAEELLVADLEIGQASRAEALARSSHPALRRFWEAGLELQRGHAIEAPAFKPLKSPEADITLAVASLSGDLPRMLAMIGEAKARQADLIALPAQALPEEAVEKLQAAAREHQITVVVGAAHRETGGLHNSAFVLGPGGSVLTRYDQLSAAAPFQPGSNAAAMWFRVKGVAAFVTIGRDALWSELSELAAVAGARVHIHLDSEGDASPVARQRRLQIGANASSFLTFSATVGPAEAIIWDDIRGRDESRAVVKGLPQPDTGTVEVYSPFSANLVTQAASGKLAIATRHVPAFNRYHPERTTAFNPQMKAWYELGAMLISPR